MAVPEAPKRRYEMNLKIGADTIEDLKYALNEMKFWVGVYYEGDQSTHGMTTSPDVSWTYEINCDPEMTHKRYFEELYAYLEAKKAEKASRLEAPAEET